MKSLTKMALLHIPTSQRGRRWTFTIPRTATDAENQLQLLQENPTVTRLIVGAEQGTATGYQHFQGFVEFLHEKSFRQVKNLLVNEAHLEKAKGSIKANFDYCTKEEDVRYCKGMDDQREDKQTKEKKDENYWREVLKDAEELDAAAFKDKRPKEWLLRRTQIERIMIECQGRRATKWNGELRQKNYWVWGGTGTGKSAWATDQAANYQTLKKNFNKWWCGFDPRYVKLVILEDYPALPQGNNLCYHMKIWADRYPFLGETKGSSVVVEPGKFIMIVTSNYAIRDCFSRTEDVMALKRRFHEIEMTKQNAPLLRCAQVDFERLKGGSKYEEEKVMRPIDEVLAELEQHEKELDQQEEEAIRLEDQESQEW
jgi:hypothetical protein